MSQATHSQHVLWTLRELEAVFAGGTDDESGGLATAQGGIQRVTIDSRLVESGDLFVALAGDPGERFTPSLRTTADGHDYVADAASRGASAALVSRPQSTAITQFRVKDTYDGLWMLGAAARRRIKGPVIAVTGSSGKTTAKTFLSAALGAYAPPGSFNNHIGVPLSLANASQDAPSWVFEIGTSHPGEIEPLARMVQPDLAILLNVHNAHIENFPSRAALIEEKSAIFSTLGSHEMRVVHDELKLPGYCFGEGAACDARITALEGDRLRLQLFGEAVSARVPGGGAHRALTLAACLLAAKLLDVDVMAATELPHDLVPAGRGNIRNKTGIEIVDDSYNANPASMQAALTAFVADPSQGRRYAVLGDMRELGEDSEDAHRQLLKTVINESALHGIVVVGAAMGDACRWLGLDEKNALAQGRWLAHYESVSQQWLHGLALALSAGDRVLVKGSNRIFWHVDFVEQLIEHIPA
jgi:UDP-N-acetylmuramoyl-tripeptide--D-alanyl-D-alanine ligase